MKARITLNLMEQRSMVTSNASLEGSIPTTGMVNKLRRYNLVIGLIHLAQGVAMLLLSNDFELPVTRGYLTGPPGTSPEQASWFGLLLRPAVALFLFLAAIDHLLMAAPGINAWYNRMIGEGRNDARWIEYSVSASLMIVLIAMISGVSDYAALIATVGITPQ